jgi:hypothetical protein
MGERNGGQLALSLTAEFRHGASPFDLEATPRYRAHQSEAGLNWPPLTIIRNPAKDC